MKPRFLLVFCLLIPLLCISCQKEITTRADISESASLLYETSKYSCYKLVTKAGNDEYDKLILVNDIPELKIFTSSTQHTKGEYDEFHQVSTFEMNGAAPIKVVSSQVIVEGGYLLTYNVENQGTMSFFVPVGTKAKEDGKSFGQDVSDCLQDVYTNHGWISVWAFIQTCFIPETAIAFVGACIIVNL